MGLKAADLHNELVGLANQDVARHSARFFKTGPGEYGEGDRFLGIRVPVIRAEVRKYRSLDLNQVLRLLHSNFHEERLLALLILVEQYQRGSEAQQKIIYELYLANTDRINNWDLIDSSAHKIVGPWLKMRDRKPLYRLAKSQSLWERRIAVISTFHFIQQDDFDDTLTIADELLHDSHDLIQKAVGWMLREVGNRDQECEVEFLKPRYQTMPRMMLRYAIEKFPEELRQAFLKGTVS